MGRFSFFLVAVVAACASPKPDPKTAQNGSGSGETCHEVTDTGSMFSHTECTPVGDQQNQKDDAQRWLKQPRSQPSAAH